MNKNLCLVVNINNSFLKTTVTRTITLNTQLVVIVITKI